MLETPFTLQKLPCTAPGCHRLAVYRKFQICAAHYKYLAKHGRLEAIPETRPDRSMCEVEGCDRPTHNRKVPFCTMHHYRFVTHGSTDVPPRQDMSAVMQARRARHGVDYNGERLFIRDWAKRAGVSSAAMGRRFEQWSVERAIETPPGKQGIRKGEPQKVFEYQGERLTVTQWAARLGFAHSTMLRRFRTWSIEDAINTPNQRPKKAPTP